MLSTSRGHQLGRGRRVLCCFHATPWISYKRDICIIPSLSLVVFRNDGALPKKARTDKPLTRVHSSASQGVTPCSNRSMGYGTRAPYNNGRVASVVYPEALRGGGRRRPHALVPSWICSVLMESANPLVESSEIVANQQRPMDICLPLRPMERRYRRRTKHGSC